MTIFGADRISESIANFQRDSCQAKNTDYGIDCSFCLKVLTFLMICGPVFGQERTGDLKQLFRDEPAVSLRLIEKGGAGDPGATLAQNAEAFTLNQKGFVLPRPVSPKVRKQMGFNDPRQHEEILDDIRQVTDQMKKIESTNSNWKSYHDIFRRLQRARISLVSELEESEFPGIESLDEYLNTKVNDIQAACAISSFKPFLPLLKELLERYPEKLAGAKARWLIQFEVVCLATHNGFRLHEKDYHRLAQTDLALGADDNAGFLLLEALHFESTQLIREKWENWICENLHPESGGYKAMVRKKSFGSPIRLQGSGFDGHQIDTNEWLVDVIIVDFWGTWCRPCIQTMPDLVKMKKKYADEGLRIVGVLCDHEIGHARKILSEVGADWPHFVDPTLTAQNKLKHPIATRYAIGGFPTLWIIDRKGILRENIRHENLEKSIVKYLHEEHQRHPQR